MIPWMAYSALTAVLIAVGALAVERLVASVERPRRFVWLAALTLAVVVPLLPGRRQSPRPTDVPAIKAEQAVPPATVSVERRQSFIPPLPFPASRTAARTAGIAWSAGSAAGLAALCTILVAAACARRRWPHRRVEGTEVYLSRRFGPALVGILAPKPVIPSWVLQEKPAARAAILRHELEHARARDHLALLYAGLVAVAFPWSPAIWWMCRRLRAAIEMDCDRRVIASGIGAADYGTILFHAGARSQNRWGLAPAMGQPKSLLERRLKTMNEKRRNLNRLHGLLLAGAAATALAIACDTRSPTQLNDAIDEVINEGRDGEAAPLATGDAAGLPLVLVDGKRVASEELWPGGGSLSPMLHALDIKRIEIVKGASATDAHGDEAAHGVIEIFTTGEDLHEVEGIRRDVTIAVTSYLNNDWYVKQLRDLPRPKQGSEDDSSFGFEVDLPLPAPDWNADLSFQVGMPVVNIGNRIRMLQTTITDGIGDAEMSFEGDGSFRGWFTLSSATRYGKVEQFLESLASAAR
ncbi:MAG: TonB-dependent receptor plug domain-containing protein [Gemmatimonadetes bacterium]|nr:TonB-dependent receptor plug domain-containing protein [Gemmatimonadota bacterium]MYD15160.1 TonB-dependent receptor plug domain-containing protein [Gemmatimonadota bacterium]MYI65129.1 TonB-dependent receptor plug domain-containing protein [Gemmatimonadota bacterium]